MINFISDVQMATLARSPILLKLTIDLQQDIAKQYGDRCCIQKFFYFPIVHLLKLFL